MVSAAVATGKQEDRQMEGAPIKPNFIYPNSFQDYHGSLDS